MENKTILGLLIALFVMTATFGAVMVFDKSVDVVETNTVFNNTITEVPAIDNVTADKINYLYENSDQAIEDKQESEAIMLVIEEMATKDFRKALALELKNSLEVEDYKDIKVSDYDMEDIEVTIRRNDNAIVEVEFYLELNRHEEAKVEVTFKVLDLDEDDDFEDAEVSEDYDFTKVKVYD